MQLAFKSCRISRGGRKDNRAPAAPGNTVAQDETIIDPVINKETEIATTKNIPWQGGFQTNHSVSRFTRDAGLTHLSPLHGIWDAIRWIHKWVLDEDNSRPIIQKAVELGINFFDTANIYSI